VASRAAGGMLIVAMALGLLAACSSGGDDGDDTTTTTDGSTTTTAGSLDEEALCESLKDDVIDGVGGDEGFPSDAAELQTLIAQLEKLEAAGPAELKTPIAVITLSTEDYAGETVPDMTTPTSAPSPEEFFTAVDDVNAYYDENCTDGSGGGAGGAGATTTTGRGGSTTSTTARQGTTTSTTAPTTTTTRPTTTTETKPPN
jgi:hypothetical protein